jgi:chemotaxis protein methyltransferase CheR
VKIRDLIYQVAGIFQPDNKLRFLEDRCQRRLKELRVATLREYYECLTVKPIRQAELVRLLNEITIGKTCFFRNLPQLDALRKVVLPAVIEAKSDFRCAIYAFGALGAPPERSQLYGTA